MLNYICNYSVQYQSCVNVVMKSPCTDCIDHRSKFRFFAIKKVIPLPSFAYIGAVVLAVFASLHVHITWDLMLLIYIVAVYCKKEHKSGDLYHARVSKNKWMGNLKVEGKSHGEWF